MLRDHRLRSCGATGRLWWFQCCKHGLPSTGWLGQSRSQKGWPWDIYLLNLSEFIHFAWGSCSFIESVFIYIHAPLEKIPILQPRSIYNFCTFSAPRSDSNKEEAVTSVFRFHNFYYPLDIAVEQEPPLTEFPWLKPSAFLATMSKTNDLHHLLGGLSLEDAKPKLLDFWCKYRQLFPAHDLWEHADSGAKPLHRCLPLYLHGDEGVTYRKDGLLVLSFQGVWGHGSSKSVARPPETYRANSTGIPLNFLQTGFQTRMLICVCPKEFMAKICYIVFHRSWFFLKVC